MYLVFNFEAYFWNNIQYYLKRCHEGGFGQFEGDENNPIDSDQYDLPACTKPPSITLSFCFPNPSKFALSHIDSQ